MKTAQDGYALDQLANGKEVDEVISIWIESSKTAHDFIAADYWLDQAPAMKEIYLPQAETWIYKDKNGNITGFISLVKNHVAALFIHPEAQQMGIGSRLIEKAKELKRELHLKVYIKNKKAVHFYQKHGFRIQETHIDENTDEEEFYMTWIQ